MVSKEDFEDLGLRKDTIDRLAYLVHKMGRGNMHNVDNYSNGCKNCIDVKISIFIIFSFL